MRNSRIHLIIAAALLLAACVKEQPQNEGATLEVGIAQEIIPVTKTYMGASDGSSRRLYWSDGDCIAVNGNASDPLSGIGEGVISARFSFSAPLASGAPFNLLYPASIYTDASHVTLPAAQTWAADGFAPGFYPMAGYSTDGSSLELNHLCAVVKVSVIHAPDKEADLHNILSATFKGRNDEQVSGNFSINYSAATLSGSSAAEADKKVSVTHSQSIKSGNVATYYIVVPARTYSSGFDIILQDASGDKMTSSYTSSVALVAGKLYSMNDIQFVPTEISPEGLLITTAEDLIAFAQNYNSKDLDVDVVATITADLIFDATSSAAFNATKGIGMKIAAGDSEDYYFDGQLNGADHTISGLNATVPLFTATGSAGVVKNLTLDSSCSFSFTHGNAAEADLGSVVGYHKGLLKSVISSADVTIAAGNISQVTALGGLVGRVTVGTVEDCEYHGNLTVPSGFSVSAKLTHIGGLVGEITNADGVVQDSYFKGTLETEARVSSTDKNNPYLFVGGIVGSVAAGNVSNCHVTGDSTKEVTMANNTAYTGTLFNHTTLAYHMAQGGIAGQNSGTVSGCTNSATTQNFVLTTGSSGTASDSNSRYYDLGGIVGLNKAGASVESCTNTGLIESRSTPRIQKVGGVAGYNLGEVSFSSNEGNISFPTSNISPYNMRVGEVGGVIGNNGGTVSFISNSGNIALSRTENANGVELKFGGVIGLSTTAVIGDEGKNISNSGNILDNYNGATVTTAGLRFGGVVGSAQASVQNVTNAGSLTFQLSSATAMSKLYMGGIVGEINSAAAVEVSGCSNSGEVHFNVNGKNAAHTGNYLGGIVGYFTTSADVSAVISGNDNSGYIHSTCNGSSTSVTDINLGGITGKLSGSSSVSISGCNNNASAEEGHENDGKVCLLASIHSGNNVGGILGYSETDVTIQESTNSGLVTYQLNAVLTNTTINGCAGGIMGTLAAGQVASLEDCINNGEVFFDNNSKGGTKDSDTGKYSGTYSGGILAKGTDVTLSGCTNNGYVHGGNPIKHNATTCYVGGIAAYLDGASSISECINTANIYNDQFVNSNNTTNAFTGGIAGFVLGASGSPVTISDCEHNTVSLGARRGYQGGILGYGNYVSLSGSSNTASSMAGSVYYAGGVAGWVQNGSISGCVFTGSTIYSSQIQANGGGGIAARLDATLVDGCNSSVTDIYHTGTSNVKDADIAGGAIVGVSGSGNTIQNCHYKPTINSVAANIAGTGSFTDGGGNVADL